MNIKQKSLVLASSAGIGLIAGYAAYNMLPGCTGIQAAGFGVGIAMMFKGGISYKIKSSIYKSNVLKFEREDDEEKKQSLQKVFNKDELDHEEYKNKDLGETKDEKETKDDEPKKGGFSK